MSAAFNVAKYYYMPLSFNNAIFNNNMLFPDDQNKTFVETRMDYPYD